MSTNISRSMTGAALALAAAAMFAGVSTQAAAEEGTVHCYGINACKGQNDCKTAENACKGQGVCKGHGFKITTKAECNNAHGSVGD